MLTIPNILSFLRAPLALVFFQANPLIRLAGLFAAMLTDFLDGFLARKFHMRSRFGTTLDPLMDKFFVFIALAVLIQEEKLSLLQASCMICRDFAVIIFGLYLLKTGHWSYYKFRSIWCGKIATALQFLVLLALIMNYTLPFYVFPLFIVLGVLALGELAYTARLRVNQ